MTWQSLLMMVVGFEAGVHVHSIEQALSRAKTRVLPTSKSNIGPTVAEPDATVMNPKSQYQLDWETEQELKKLNPGRF